MDNVKKISSVGESWSEYRKKHYTAEEIAENDLMVELVGEMIKTRNQPISSITKWHPIFQTVPTERL